MAFDTLETFLKDQATDFGMFIQNPNNKVSYDDMKDALNKHHTRLMSLAAKVYSASSSTSSPVTPKRPVNRTADASHGRSTPSNAPTTPRQSSARSRKPAQTPTSSNTLDKSRSSIAQDASTPPKLPLTSPVKTPINRTTPKNVSPAVGRSPAYKGPPMATEQYSPSMARWDGNRILTHDQVHPRSGYGRNKSWEDVEAKMERKKAKENRK